MADQIKFTIHKVTLADICKKRIQELHELREEYKEYRELDITHAVETHKDFFGLIKRYKGENARKDAEYALRKQFRFYWGDLMQHWKDLYWGTSASNIKNTKELLSFVSSSKICDTIQIPINDSTNWIKEYL